MSAATTIRSAYSEVNELPEDFTLFLRSDYTILTPRKTVAAMKYIPDGVLREVHPDLEVARELCLYFLSMMTRAYFEEHRRVRLHSQILQRLFRLVTRTSATNDYLYVRIRTALTKGTPKAGPIVGYDTKYTVGSEAMSYWLTEAYSKTGFAKYEVTTDFVKGLVQRNYYEQLAIATENVIARNLFRFYTQVKMPTVAEATARGAALAKSKYKTKKGKTLTMRHRKDPSYWKDVESRSFVEDALDRYAYLTESGLIVPIIGGERSGGRVYDTISLMPSWIRDAMTINGRPVVELDYKALHPNLAMKIYGGAAQYVTHSKVAEESGVPRADVKVEHLSFFNKRWEGVEKSPLYAYYLAKEPAMMEAMCRDKAENGHTATSRKMFALEVQLMTEVIKRLNTKGIYVGYAYDALYVAEDCAEVAEAVMNAVALEMGIYTATVEVADAAQFSACLQAHAIASPPVLETTKTVSADDVLGPAITHENKQRRADELAPEAAPGHAEPLGGPQDSARTRLGTGLGIDSEPRQAPRAAEAIEGPEDEPLAVRAGGRRQPDERPSKDFPCHLELQEELAGEHHEDENALRQVRRADGGRGLGTGPGLPGGAGEGRHALEADEDAADRGRELLDSAGPAKPAGFDTRDVEDYSEEDFAYRHYLNRQLAYA